MCDVITCNKKDSILSGIEPKFLDFWIPSSTPRKRATKLRYVPMHQYLNSLADFRTLVKHE